MPQAYDQEGPLYVASPQGFSLVLRRVEMNLPAPEAIASPERDQIGTLRRGVVMLRGEPFPGDIPFAHALALAVLKGETGAALLLANLVQEQHTGSRSELQAEMAKREKQARDDERELCAATLGKVRFASPAGQEMNRAYEEMASHLAKILRDREQHGG